MRVEKEHKKLFFRWYQAKRSGEFMDNFHSEDSWNRLSRRIYRTRIRKMVSCAAAVAVVVFFGGVLYWQQQHVAVEKIAPVAVNGFSEKGVKTAVLTLADGRKIDLSLTEGVISGETEVVITNDTSHQLVYATSGEHPGGDVNHVLSVPRGGEYRLILSDGTRVWVNAETVLRYPESFGNRREIYLEGEAYFEVKRDTVRPFVVHVGNSSIQVLGTHFNVSAYGDSKVYTTLVEGKVQVNTPVEQVVLCPNQQAVIGTDEKCIEVKDVDASMFVSWIKGNYIFRNTKLEDIVLQLSRWYNIDICFDDVRLGERRFAGMINRHEELEFVLDVIGRVAGVCFVCKDNKLYIRDM